MKVPGLSSEPIDVPELAVAAADSRATSLPEPLIWRNLMTEQKQEKPSDSKTPETEKAADDWQEQEDYLEEALEETFPGSDPISPGHPNKSKQ